MKSLIFGDHFISFESREDFRICTHVAGTVFLLIEFKKSFGFPHLFVLIKVNVTT